jgi:hypothetical protein
MSVRTVFLARLFGLYCLIIAAAMLPQAEALVSLVHAIVADAPLVLIAGVWAFSLSATCGRLNQACWGRNWRRRRCCRSDPQCARARLILLSIGLSQKGFFYDQAMLTRPGDQES